MNATERDLLDFESAHPRNDRSREAAIRATFGYSWVRYQQHLLALVRTEDALLADPTVCRRVLRVSSYNGLRRSVH